MTKFWVREDMNVMMGEYRKLFIIDREAKSIALREGVSKQEVDRLYEPIYTKHIQMAEVVMAHNRNRDRIAGCAARLFEIMMLSWDPGKNANSYGYFYRCAHLYSLDWISGRIDKMGTMYSRVYHTSVKHKFKQENVPSGVDAKEYARKIAEEEHGWHDYKLEFNDKNDTWIIKHMQPYRPYESYDACTNPRPLQYAEQVQVASVSDQIDWQILSEYIPDVPCSDINKELAYTFLEIMKELIDEHPEAIKAQRTFGNLIYEMMRSRMPVHITRSRIAEVRQIVRQAYIYYSEDFIEYEAPAY
jgi:hypothetical protein